MTYRIIDTCIWSDPWFEELEQDEKLLFIYLFTNENCNQAGITKQGSRRIAFHIGSTKEKVDEMLDKMQASGKVVRQGDMVACMSFIKHQARNGNFMLAVKKAVDSAEEGKLRQRLTEQYTKVEATPKQPRSNREATPKQPESEGLPLSLKERVIVKGREKEKEKEKTDIIISFPDSLKTQKFMIAWSEWKQYRKEKKKPLTPMGEQKALNALAEYGEEWARERINKAIAAGWQGLIFDNDKPKDNKPDYLNGLAY